MLMSCSWNLSWWETVWWWADDWEAVWLVQASVTASMHASVYVCVCACIRACVCWVCERGLHPEFYLSSAPTCLSFDNYTHWLAHTDLFLSGKRQGHVSVCVCVCALGPVVGFVSMTSSAGCVRVLDGRRPWGLHTNIIPNEASSCGSGSTQRA